MAIEPDSLHQAPISDPSSPRLTILVVEDNLINQKVVSQQLQSLGYGVDLAANGQAALDVTETTYYPIILMDCRLPKIDGYMATRQIRLREQQRRQPRSIIIALTASDDPKAQQEAIAAGMDDFLTKPLHRETLATVIENWYRLLNQSISMPTPSLPSFLLTKPSRISSYFDLDQLNQLSDCNWEFAQELIQLYLDDTKQQVQLLSQAIQQHNLQQIEQLAHHIRGASANIGAVQIERITDRMERLAAQTQTSSFNDLYVELQQALTQIETDLIDG
ncbi:MAG: response regulator [Elainella sp. Prado103]|jgi:CheY-like chemotaxis protein|nr:response regulator [Elainella sp. Prado103]